MTPADDVQTGNPSAQSWANERRIAEMNRVETEPTRRLDVL